MSCLVQDLRMIRVLDATAERPTPSLSNVVDALSPPSSLSRVSRSCVRESATLRRLQSIAYVAGHDQEKGNADSQRGRVYCGVLRRPSTIVWGLHPGGGAPSRGEILEKSSELDFDHGRHGSQ